MPALEQQVLDDLSLRLQRYLMARSGYAIESFLSSGGSAAVFKVASPAGPRAIKVYSPEFLADGRGDAERRRLALQRRLVGHDCPWLVRLHAIDEAEGTAFVEMDLVDWPGLSNVLADVPDEKVAKLILQLVDAVKFLELQEIVHRDIKPENIHIAPDFSQLILLDLGVARELQHVEEGGAGATDHGALRPFIATAQYSSPEYLFRLDEPSPNLWKGLSLYQVGAVLHDLIIKRPIFDSEVKLGNKWLVARAVLTKTPSFEEATPGRLISLKAVAARCLAKDLQTRLAFVDWSDFAVEAGPDPLVSLKGFLNQTNSAAGAVVAEAGAAKVRFERGQCIRRIREAVRADLIEACGTKLPPSVGSISAEQPDLFDITFSPPGKTSIKCRIRLRWQQELHQYDADTCLVSALVAPDSQDWTGGCVEEVCGIAHASGDSEEIVVRTLSGGIAKAVKRGLELLMTSGSQDSVLVADLLSK
jgi:serine/threonine-protein kinase